MLTLFTRKIGHFSLQFSYFVCKKSTNKLWLIGGIARFRCAITVGLFYVIAKSREPLI